MHASRRFGWYIGFIILLGLSGQSRGQTAEGTVTGVGSATIARSPNLLRMTVELTAEAKDITAALEKLRAAEADARKRLLAIGAAERSVKLSDVRDGSVKSQRQLQMEMYTRQQMSARGRKPATSPSAPVKLIATLTAAWALNGSGDELLTHLPPPKATPLA